MTSPGPASASAQPRPVEIIGGGLAGLSLGLALRRSGVPVTLFEAGVYPRHRVCGEFITGLAEDTIDRLGLAPFLADAKHHREIAWFKHGESLRRQTLPEPALALSRHSLDKRLATAFVTAGGDLRTQTRIRPDEAPAGRIFSTGRRPARPQWIGLKCHAFHLPLAAELELHLGDQAYVGLCPVEDGRVNVSGLFRQRDDLDSVNRETALFTYLRAAGLAALADRLAVGEIDPASFSAVAGLGFSKPSARTDRIVLGDTYAMIPPFTGHGMAMAFQSAQEALDPLLAWSHGRASWPATLHTVQTRLRHLFRIRLSAAAVLHPFLYQPAGQRWLGRASRLGLLPLRSLYRVTH
jgi:menaquinone-9 beta-reductase